jgi:hypothetical protein
MAVDLLDILTEAEATRAAFGTEAAAQVDQIHRMNTAVSRRIDELVGPVVQRTVTEYHDGGTDVIYPRLYPVASVTSVTEWDGSAQTVLTADTWGVAGAASGFFLDVDRILRRSGGSAYRFTSGSQSVKLVYVAGRYADTAAVDARFKEAAAEVLRRLWNRESGAWARGSDPFQDDQGGSSRFFRAFDVVIAELLADELLPPAVA